MKIIDFHTHIYPDAIAQKAADSISAFYELEGGGMDGTVSTLLKRGEEAGVTHYVVLPVGLKPNHVRSINSFILEQVAKYPQMTGFGTIHASMVHLEEEVEFIHAKGLKGIKMHPDTQLFGIDDPQLFPAYDLMSQLGLPVMLHMGDQRYDYSHPQRLRNVMDQFPDLKVVAAHFGGYSMYEAAYELLHDKDCIMDVSSSLMFMDKQTAVTYIRKYGAERLVYGSDYPLWDPVVEMKRFQSLELTDEEIEQIMYKTAAAFLNFDENA